MKTEQHEPQIIDMAPIGMTFRIIRTAAETQGCALDMEWRLLPHAGGTPLHVHPAADETYRVLEGQLALNLNGRWQLLEAGEALTVPKGTPHTFRNPGGGIVRVYNSHEPALRFQEYFEGLGKMTQKLSNGRQEPLRMNLKTAMYFSMLMRRHRQELVSVNPPALLVRLLNGIGKLIGLRLEP